MASANIPPFLPLLLLFVLFGGVRASDSDVLLRLFTDLRLTGGPSSDPCSFPGISCEGHGISLRATGISLESMGLGGFLSPSVGGLSSLRELSLANNLLSGVLPNEIPACRGLEILNLRGNSFSGEIPDEMSALVNLRVLDLSSNQFVGDLGFITYFPNLENLSLSHNLFSGEIPKSLSFHRNLLFLDLSGNPGLHNSIPELALEKYSLGGDILPKRYVFAEKTARNNKSTTVVDVAAVAPSPSPTTSPDNRNKEKKVRNWLIGFIIGALVGILSGLFLSVLYRLVMNCIRGRYRNPGGPAIFSPLIKRAEDLAFLERDDEMTSLEVIGRGGCGEVYRAQLPSGPSGAPGKMIAIKKIKRFSLEDGLELSEEDSKLLDKWMRQIRAEIQTVGHIRHRNLLPLLAHVSRPDCNYLIYEFMKNGSLHDALNGATDGTWEFDWPARLKIAAGIAAGLEYLHMQHSPRIIHRDLKPANILLDDNLEARIADFGLAKAVPDANTHVTTSNVAGTVGYIAPEYYQMLKFTDKCDIYSFGVILAVLVIGMLPSDEFFQSTDELSLVKWLRKVMKSEDPAAVIDPKLLRSGLEAHMVLVLRIACFCTADDPKERPNSKDVRCMLSQIV